MHITGYSFGKLLIDKQEYSSDLVIYEDKILSDHWWRKQGHLLQVTDVKPFLDHPVTVVLVGRGFSGRMKIAQKLQYYLLERDIVLQGLSTKDACQRYNEMKHKGLLAFFHLTC